MWKNKSLNKKKLECKRTYKEFNNNNLKQQQEKNENHVVVKLKEILSFIKNTFSTAKNVLKTASQFVVSHAWLFASIALIVIAIVLLCTSISSFSSMATSGVSAIISSSYTATDYNINEAEKIYREMELKMQEDIANIKNKRPNFDVYRKEIDNIGHNPYELISYLTAEYDDFDVSKSTLKNTLNKLFHKQYKLTYKESFEIKSDGDGNTYKVRVLTTYLEVTPLSEIIKNRLRDYEKIEKYNVYMQTKRGRQYFSSPFLFDWIPYVSKINPDNSVNMNVPNDVDVMSAKGEKVTKTRNTVIIEDSNGYFVEYSGILYCNVNVDDEVKIGDVIGIAQNRIKLTFSYKGEILNPYFFVASNGESISGFPNTPNFSNTPSSPMGDGSLEALIAEAEKYLDYPYVWGGSSPSTSFDCSGFVCWSYTHSGVYNLPRTTAQGIFNQCVPVSKNEAKPGDLVFFTGTYSTANPVTHVGIVRPERRK